MQELADLIPTVTGPGPFEFLSYNADTQTLNVSLDFFRQPEPIVAQADLSLLAGREETPFASVQMTPGELGTDNRLEITRSASLGMALAFDLSSREVSTSLNTTNLSEDRPNSAQAFTPMQLIMERYGLGFETSVPQSIGVRLRDGRIATLNLGALDAHTTIGEVIERGKVYDGNELGLSLSFQNDRFVIEDWTTGPNDTELMSAMTEFWNTLFPDAIDTQGSGISSRPLSGSWLSEFGTQDTTLDRFTDPEDLSNADPAAPLEIRFADGRSRIVTLPALSTLHVADLADGLTLEEGGETILETVFSASQGRFVLHDRTTPVGDNHFSVGWAGSTSGSPSIAKFVPIGKDSDRNGRLEGPRLIPQLPYDRVSPIDRSTTLGSLLFQPFDGSVFAEPSTAEWRLKNGTSVTVSTGALTPDTTLGDLMDRLLVEQQGEVVLEPLLLPNDDRLYLVDHSDGNSLFEMTDATGSLFLSWFASDPIAVDSPDDRVIVSESLATRGFEESSLTASVLPDHLQGVSGSPARITLLSGEEVTVDVGILGHATTLRDVAERLTVIDSGITKLKASVRDDRIVLEDSTSPASSDAETRVAFEDMWGPTFHFLRTEPGDDGRDGMLVMQPFAEPASAQVLPRPEPPKILLETQTPPPDWTTIQRLLERNGPAQSSAEAQVATLRLRDGTELEWHIADPATTSLEELVSQAAWYRNDDPSDERIAELQYESGRLIVRDLTSGGSSLAITNTNGRFWDFFREIQDIDNDGRLRSEPLRVTMLEGATRDVPLLWLLSDNTTAVTEDSATLRLTLRDGTTRSIQLGTLESHSLGTLLEALTIRQNGRVVVSATFQDGGIVLVNHQPSGETPFSIVMETDGNEWPRIFLPLGSDTNNDGALYGVPFFPLLPDADFPPPSGSSLTGGIRINAATRLGDYAELSGLAEMMGTASTVVVSTRDGGEYRVVVQNNAELSLQEYLEQFRIVDDGRLVLDVEVERVDGVQQPLNSRFVLYDLTQLAGGEERLSIQLASDAAPGQDSLLPALLGITGADEGDNGAIVGPRLRPNTLQDRTRILLAEPPVLRAEFNASPLTCRRKPGSESYSGSNCKTVVGTRWHRSKSPCRRLRDRTT